ncbi:MAG: hypothetical protein ACE5IY_02660 [bacterium]
MLTESDNYYFSEFMRSLHRMSSILTKLKPEEDNQAHLAAACEAAHRIRDLAMVHGYAGVENVANKFCQQFGQFTHGKKELDAQLLEKVESGVMAIRRLAEIEDSVEDQMIVEHLNWRAEPQSTREICQSAQWFDNRQLELFHHDANIPALESRLAIDFEIQECDAILTGSEKQMAWESKNMMLDLFDK